MTEPLLKYPGGKRKIAPMISDLFRSPFTGEWIEPFAGACGVFLGIDLPDTCDGAILSDAEPRIVNFHRVVRDQPDDLLGELEALRPHEVSEAGFYGLRELLNHGPQHGPTAAAVLLVLNKGAHNVGYRVNSEGHYNVPAGTRTKAGKGISVPTETHIREVSAKLQRATILCEDYAAALARAGAGDRVYCDPPYLQDPNRATPAFTQYTAARFGMRDQLALSLHVRLAALRGAEVIISNQDCDDARAMYSDGEIVATPSVARPVSRNSNRPPSDEIFVRFGPWSEA